MLAANKIHQWQYFCMLVLMLCVSSVVQANPIGGQVVHGQAIIQSSGSTTSITNTPGAIINWQSFSIGRNEATRFIQQNGSSSVLNRVTGRLPTDILGKLTSNGKVFVINPNGLVIGKGARIDTAGFVGSTLDTRNEDFLAGKLNFKGNGGKLENHGMITVGKGGEVILIAPSITNTGVIQAPDGEILLAAGREVTLTSLDGAKISYVFSAPGDKAVNLGKLLSENGSIKVFADQIQHVGEISANRVSTAADGSVLLEADTEITVSGQINATGQVGQGGEVFVLGQTVTLTGAKVNVSGSSGGGTALIGGDYQGGNSVRTAATTQMDVTSVIQADALNQGNGGKVIIWSDNNTNSFGKISAMGGVNDGDGGLVETSGKQNLNFGQPVDVSAPKGQPGTWLIDPQDITIGSSEAASISASLNGGSNVKIKTSDTGSGEGNISVNAPITKTAGPDASLSLDAHNRIDVNASITSTEAKLNMSLRAGTDIAVNAAVDTNGGKFSAEIIGVVNTGDLISNEQVEDQATEHDGEQMAPSELEQNTEQDQENITSISPPNLSDDTPQRSSVDTPVVLQNFGKPETDGLHEEVVLASPIELSLKLDSDQNQVVISGMTTTDGGSIAINAGENGDVVVYGVLDSASDTHRGGDITLEAERIALLDGAVLDASGEGGGGEILIGGGQQGLDQDTQNAQFTYIDEGVEVHSDGGQAGNGGRVIVYADNTANILGKLTARGGEQSGDGGFIETSGKQSMVVSNAPDVSSQNGQAGAWLIDPISVRIVNGSPDLNIVDTDLTLNQLWQPNAAGAVITADTINAGLSSGANITITTSESSSAIVPLAADLGDINWEADLNLNGNINTGDLTLLAHNDINWTGSIYDSEIGTVDLDERVQHLTLVADQDGSGAGDINVIATGSNNVLIQTLAGVTMSGANVNIAGGSGANIGSVDILAQSINIGTLSNPITGDVTISGGDSAVLGGEGAVTLDAYGINHDLSVNATGDISLQGGAGDGNQVNLKTGTLGVISLNASESITMTGGAGESAAVLLDSRNGNWVAGGDITLHGGEGLGANVNSNVEGKQDINSGGDLTLSSGVGGNVSVRGNLLNIIVADNLTLTTKEDSSGRTVQLTDKGSSTNVTVGGNVFLNHGDNVTNGTILLGKDRLMLNAGEDINAYGGDAGLNNNILLRGNKKNDITAGGDLTLDGGSGDGSTINILSQEKDPTSGGATINADNLSLLGGLNGRNNFVRIFTSNLDLNLLGDLNLLAQGLPTASSFINNEVSIVGHAGIIGIHDYSIDGDVNIIGGGSSSPAYIGSGSEREWVAGGGQASSLTMDIAGDLNLISGIGKNSHAFIRPRIDRVNISANNILIQGGTDQLSDAGIIANGIARTGGASQTITALGDIRLVSGTSGGSSARIEFSMRDSLGQLGKQKISANNIELDASTGGNAAAILITSVNDQLIDVSENFNANSLNTEHIKITAEGAQSIDVGSDINLTGASIVSSDTSTIQANNILLNNALINADKLDIVANQNMLIDGADIFTTAGGKIDLNVGNKLTLSGDSGISSEQVTVNTQVNIVAHDFDWISGRIAAIHNGSLTTDGLTRMLGDNDRTLIGTNWDQLGNVIWSQGDLILDDASINNSGQFTLAGDGLLIDDDSAVFVSVDDASSEFNNLSSGILIKSGGVGTTAFRGDLYASNEGRIEAGSGRLLFDQTLLQTAGETDLNGGDIVVNNGFKLDGGSLVGVGGITGNVNATAATIGPGHSPGTININGDFTSSSATQFDFEIGGASAGDYDVLNVSGTANLAGNMSIDFINGYMLASGTQAQFDLITAGILTGNLGLTHGSDFPSDVNFTKNVTGSAYNLAYARNALPVEQPIVVPEPIQPLSPVQITPLPIPQIEQIGIVLMAQPPEPEEEFKGLTVEAEEETEGGGLLGKGKPKPQMCTASY